MSSLLAGTLMMSSVERHSDGSAQVLANVKLDEIHVSLSGRDVRVPRANFAPLERGFLVNYSASGAVLGMALEEDTHPIAARLAAQVIAFLQLVAPPPHATVWESDARDSMGELHARYSFITDAPSQPNRQWRVRRKWVPHWHL